MVRKVFIFIVLIVQVIIIFAQEEVDYAKFKGTDVKISLPIWLDNSFLKKYTFTNIRRIYDTTDVFENTAEKLLQEIFVNGFNETYMETSIPDDKRITIRQVPIDDTTKDNYLILKMKLSFIYQENEVSILKFQEVRDSIAQEKQIGMFIQKNNQWKLFYDPAFSEIASVILQISADALSKADGGTIPSKALDFLEKDAKQLKSEDGTLNLSLLYAYLENLKKSNPERYKLVCD